MTIEDGNRDARNYRVRSDGEPGARSVSGGYAGHSGQRASNITGARGNRRLVPQAR